MSAHLLMVFLEPGKLFWLSNYVNIVINEKFSSRSRVKHFICCGKFVNLVERFFLPSRLWPSSGLVFCDQTPQGLTWGTPLVGLLTLFCFGFGFGLELLSSLVMEDFLRLRQARHINYSFRFWFASAAGYQKALQEKRAPKKPRKIQRASCDL